MADLTFVADRPWPLESGEALDRLVLAYTDVGPRVDARRVVWVCHALTANADPREWWPTLIGPGRTFDPALDRIVCANMLGSCYGSSGPLTPRGDGSGRYWSDFPAVTIRDSVGALIRLRQRLGIEHIDVVIGGSMGGQQALEWALAEPDRIDSLVAIATNARHSPWGIAFNEAQRMAIRSDPSWADHRADAGRAGIAAARAVAMLSYRSYEQFERTQLDATTDVRLPRAASYQRHQGEKLADRFDVTSYLRLSEAMDRHRVGNGREPVESVLTRVRARTLAIGIQSDVLFPIHEQQLLATHIPRARYAEIDSPYGHDGFLVEGAALGRVIAPFLPVKRRRNAS